MKPFFKKFNDLAEAIELEKGPFAFFGLLHGVDALDLWDVVASAPWLIKNGSYGPGIIEMSNRVSAVLTLEEKLRVSRVVVLPANHPVITALLESEEIVPGRLARAPGGFVDTDFDRAYVIVPRQMAHAL